MVLDVTRAEQERRGRAEQAARAQAELAEQAARAQAELAEQTARGARLAASERELLAANMEMGAANAELRGRHEDAPIRTEEAQAAIEEVETLNEELQASNEELETLNEELQANNEELHATNAELQARASELIEQAVVVEQQRLAAETERARLEMVLAAMADAVLVVTPDGAEAQSNEAYARMFGPTGLVAATDRAGEPLPEDALPARRAARGDTFSMAFTLTSPTGRRWFEAVGGPVEQMGALHWGVVVIRDITGRTMHRLQEEFLATTSHELQTPLTAVRAGLGLLNTALGPTLQPPERELLAVMRRNVERLHHSIDELLAGLAPATAMAQVEGSLR